jgi:hypothetical protein
VDQHRFVFLQAPQHESMILQRAGSGKLSIANVQRAGLAGVLLEAGAAGVGRGQLVPRALAEAAIGVGQQAHVVERAQAFECLKAKQEGGAPRRASTRCGCMLYV